MMRTFRKVLVVTALMLGALPVFGQGEMPPLPGEALLSDVGSPRGISVDADGNLIVAIAGTGGDLMIESTGPDGSVMPFSAGMTGSIVSIAPDGTVTELLSGIPSYAAPQETLGAYRAYRVEETLWVLYSLVPGAVNSNMIIQYDLATTRPVTTITLNGFELANNPDGNEIDSNVADIAWLDDGTMLIVDAGANALLTWTADDGLALVTAWPENSVPTSVEVDANGDLWIGFLGAGLAPGAGKIEHWSNGEIVETYEGLNAVTDILLTDDGVLAVELVRFGEQGPGAGGVVRVNADGVSPVVDGLIAPFSAVQTADGSLAITHGTVAFAPGMLGGVVRVGQ
ncbi:MAG: ScyD/ScyE family protein [bacterium]|nr:ScyD/ScyE family protein [bacterium]